MPSTFAALKKDKRSAFVPFVTAGDPDADTFLEIIQKLPAAGADVIEIGIPFSDPMADGPTNQASYLRALKSGMTVVKLLELVRRFRKTDSKTPIVLMGAYNPVHAYGTARFARDAAEAGVDGLLMVDLPAEEDDVLRLPAASHGIDIIRFLAPTTDDETTSRSCSTAPVVIFTTPPSRVSPARRLTQSQMCRGLARSESNAQQISPAWSVSESKRPNRLVISPPSPTARWSDQPSSRESKRVRRRGWARCVGRRRDQFLSDLWPNRCMQPSQLLW